GCCAAGRPAAPVPPPPGGPAAAQAMLDVHRALDRMVAELAGTAGDATMVAFAMDGMGPNHSDIESMVVLPELLHRHVFGAPLLRLPAAWTSAPSAMPLLGEESGERRLTALAVTWAAGASRSVARALPRPVQALAQG